MAQISIKSSAQYEYKVPDSLTEWPKIFIKRSAYDAIQVPRHQTVNYVLLNGSNLTQSPAHCEIIKVPRHQTISDF